eukprot:scaffold32_cov368-Prasinococcus_capsulatus_cf.AAC.9
MGAPQPTSRAPNGPPCRPPHPASAHAMGGPAYSSDVEQHPPSLHGFGHGRGRSGERGASGSGLQRGVGPLREDVHAAGRARSAGSAAAVAVPTERAPL